jgi:hypothetical protein
MASMPGLALTDLWETGAAPASNAGDKDAAARPVRLEPPKNGTILRIVEFPPDSAWRNSADGAAAFKSIGAGHAQDRASSDPMMHKTSTVDYIIVLKGEIHAIMETGEKLLRAGDILVQRGTNHSGACAEPSPASSPRCWSARSPRWTQEESRQRSLRRRPEGRESDLPPCEGGASEARGGFGFKRGIAP